MNPYGPSGDMFRTDANQSANSFSDPLNISHLYPGWGMNPNYQTPAGDAPYRPAYQGPNPYASYTKPGFLGAISQLYSPGYKDPYWGNPVSNNENAFNSVASRPVDLMAHIGQNYVAPAVAFGLASQMLSGVGKNLGRGLLGGSGRYLAGGGGAAVGRAVGGVVGAFGLPLAVGLAASEAIDAAVFQPYVRSRQMSETARDSFSGVTFSGYGGNSISGRGLSGKESAGIGNSIDRSGMRDMTFSANQYHGIAGMGMRSGLFDDVGSSGDITKRVSSIAAQIKMIVAISKDPNIQSAIEELSKLRLGGASVTGGSHSQAAGAYSSIGMQASAAGASVQRVMNTVGTQGQYMFQMNGITPYLGQMAGATAFAGFAAAQRQGMVSNAQMARMGGVEGATQSALAAQMSGSQTPFNRMQLANQFLGTGKTSGVVDTVTAFGQLSSKDPFTMMGNMTLFDGHMRSQQAEQEGSSSLENQAVSYLKTVKKEPIGKDGKYSAGQLAAAMMGMGIPQEQIQAYATLRASQTDSNVVGQNVKAFKAQESEQLRQVISQEGLYGGIAYSAYKSAKTTAIDVGNLIADGTGRAWNSTVGSMYDSVANSFETWNHGSTIKDRATGGFEVDMNAVNSKFNVEGSGLQNSKKYSILSQLNTSAKSGGAGSEIAKKLLEVGFDSPESKKLFADFIKSQPGSEYKKIYAALDNSSKFYDEVAGLARGNILNTGAGTEDDAMALNRITGDSTEVFDNLKVIGQAEQMFGSDDRLGLNLEENLKSAKYAELAANLKNVPEKDRVAKIRSMAMASLEGGYGKSALVASRMSKGESADLAKRSGGSIKGTGIKVNESSSREEIGRLFAVMDSSGKAINDAVKNSSSQVDWKGFVEASNKIDKAANIFLEAADKIAGTTGTATSGVLGSPGQKPSGGGFQSPIREFLYGRR